MVKKVKKMIVYHISDKVYSPNTTVTIDDFGKETLYHQGLTDEKKAVDVYLSEGRPEGSPLRERCFYAFARMEQCIAFSKDRLINGERLHLYKVEMNCLAGSPMYLVNQILVSKDKKEKIRQEYWCPTHTWNFIEYLATNMHIIEEIPITPQLRTRAFGKDIVDYSKDREMAKRLFS